MKLEFFIVSSTEKVKVGQGTWSSGCSHTPVRGYLGLYALIWSTNWSADPFILLNQSQKCLISNL